MRVAIIGGGPRALWACEQLSHWASTLGARIDVAVFEPGRPGAGHIYRSEQPDYWRLNVNSEIVRTGLGAFDDWRSIHHGSDTADRFPPRRTVGAFLSASWEHLLRALPDTMTVTHFPSRVDDIRTSDVGAWEVEGRPYDEILISTGHARTWPGALRHTYRAPRLPIIDPLSPEELSSVPEGSTVAVRGAALTFVDAVLALTLGRGGSFSRAADLAGPGGLTYRASGHEPAQILPVSRSGRFISVKPEPEGPLSGGNRSDALDLFRREIRRARSVEAMESTLAESSQALLEFHGVDTPLAHIDNVVAGKRTIDDPVEELRRSWEVSTGQRAPDAAWAVGEAWRSLYPDIVARTAYGGSESLPGFAALARRMEGIAFGAIPESAEKLLALIDCGLVDATKLGQPQIIDAALGGAEPKEEGHADIEVVVDAVLAPPGPAPGSIVSTLLRKHGPASRVDESTLKVDSLARVPDIPHLSVIGRDIEPTVIGHDTLSRKLHKDVDNWAHEIAKKSVEESLDRRAHGDPKLTGRLESWMVDLLADPIKCRAIVDEFGSPANVHVPGVLPRNADELIAAGDALGVDVRVFFARKANKSLAFVDAAREAGHGVDVASHRELAQTLERSVPGERIILSAAIKPEPLLALAIDHGVTISLDSERELERVAAIAKKRDRIANVAPRLAPDPWRLPPTRFGQRLHEWQTSLSGVIYDNIRVVGIHAHLHGYAVGDRAIALEEALALVDFLNARDHHLEFIDLGGGVPMSYLDDRSEWDKFMAANNRAIRGEGEPFTWNDAPLTNFYPFHQEPTRGSWLAELLRTTITVDGSSGSAASHLNTRELRLHLEPGRALLDGCGLILATVAFVKKRSDGVSIVGVEMNRTQCRTTSDDILVDPILVPGPGVKRPPASEAFLVGAYCIEDEIIVKRKIHFPNGVAEGDIVAFPNTAGYFMHIVESASHQIPLARNVVLTSTMTAVGDDIDTWTDRSSRPGSDGGLR